MDRIDISKTILQIGISFYHQILKNKESFVPKKFGDFRYSFVVRFPPKGSSITQSHNLQEFDFIIVAPIGFSIIHERFSILTIKIMSEILKQELTICTNNIFDKDKLMFGSDASKYKLIHITHHESTNIVNYLQRYSKCVSPMIHSFFPRLLGIFSFKYPSKSQKIYHFLLFTTRIPNDFKMHKKFELYFNEKYYENDEVSDRQPLENTIFNIGTRLSDFRYNFPDGLLMNQKQRRRLFNILDYDFELLRTLRIFNFSFRLYVHNFNISKREMLDEITRFKRRSGYMASSLVDVGYRNQVNKDVLIQKFALLKNPNKQNSNFDHNMSSKFFHKLKFSEDSATNKMSFQSKSHSYDSLLLNNYRIRIEDKYDQKKKPSSAMKKSNLFSSTKVLSNFFIAKRHGALFVYDIKGEYLAIFCVFGHIALNAESTLMNWKSIIKSSLPEFCTQRIISSAVYSDKFETFLKYQIFKPVHQDMFEAWPDDSKLYDDEKASQLKIAKIEQKWQTIQSQIFDRDAGFEVEITNSDGGTTTGTFMSLYDQ